MLFKKIKLLNNSIINYSNNVKIEIYEKKFYILNLYIVSPNQKKQ